MNETFTLFSKEDFLSLLSLDEPGLGAWEKAGILVPAGWFDTDKPYYDEQSVAQGEKLKGLMALGYALEDIRKIVAKVGLPSRALMDSAFSGRLLTVGELAERSGVGARTLRHWEDKGLVVPDARSKGGFRLYGEDFLEICARIRELQLLGYSLEEVKQMRLLLLPGNRLRRALLETGEAQDEDLLGQFSAVREALQVRVGEIRKALRRWEAVGKEQTRILGQMAARQKARNKALEEQKKKEREKDKDKE